MSRCPDGKACVKCSGLDIETWQGLHRLHDYVDVRKKQLMSATVNHNCGPDCTICAGFTQAKPIGAGGITGIPPSASLNIPQATMICPNCSLELIGINTIYRHICKSNLMWLEETPEKAAMEAISPPSTEFLCPTCGPFRGTMLLAVETSCWRCGWRR